MPKKPSGVHGVMVVRNAWDLIILNLLHHFQLGVDHIHVADNGSTDGTVALIEEIGRHYPVTLTHEPGAFEQMAITNRLIADARTAGARWVIPIDADEFWDVLDGKLAKIVRSMGKGINGQRVPVINYAVPHTEVTARAGCVLAACWRTPNLFAHTDENKERAVAGEIPVALFVSSEKCVFKSHCTIGKGGHRWIGMPAKTTLARDLAIRHVPTRHQGVIQSRIESGHRSLLAEEYRPGASWHVTRLVNMSDPELDLEWQGNCATRGALLQGGQSYPLTFDTSLRDLLRPRIREAREIYRSAGVDPRFRWSESHWRTVRKWERLRHRLSQPYK